MNEEQMEELGAKAIADGDNVEAAVYFGTLKVDLGDAYGARILYALIRAGNRPDGLIVKNHTTEGVRQIRLSCLD